jgi:hypothetical protein
MVESITPASGRVALEMFRVGFVTVGSGPDERLNDLSDIDADWETNIVLLVEMLDAQTLRIERFEGPGISAGDVTEFTANARMYVRNPIG